MALTQEEEEKAWMGVGEALVSIFIPEACTAFKKSPLTEQDNFGSDGDELPSLTVHHPDTAEQHDLDKLFIEEMTHMCTKAFGIPARIAARTTPRRMSNCPYCHAGIDTEAQGVRYYECGTRVVADPNVRYVKGCGK